MKCEICNFQETPDNLNRLVNQAETCQTRLCRKAKVVWREGQMTITLSPQANETEFDVVIRDMEDAPPPPVVVFNATKLSNPTNVHTGRKDRKRDSDDL
jgi:hypothetical protein